MEALRLSAGATLPADTSSCPNWVLLLVPTRGKGSGVLHRMSQCLECPHWKNCIYRKLKSFQDLLLGPPGPAPSSFRRQK